MKVSSSIIARDIRKRISFSVFGSLEGELDFERPLFLRPGVELRDNRVYLAEEETIEKVAGILPKKRFRSLLLFAGNKPDALLPLFDTVFIFENVPLVDIFEIVEAAIFRFDLWDKDIEQLLEENCGVEEILSRSDEIFGNPLVLTDRFFKVVAFSKQYAKDYPVMIMPLIDIDGGKTKKSASDECGKTAGGKNMALIQAKIKGVRSLCFNIFRDNTLCRRLFLLEYSRKIYQSDNALLEHVGDKIRRALEAQHLDAGSIITGFSGLLKSLLSGSGTRTDVSALEAAEARLKKITNQNECIFFCVVIKPAGSSITGGSIKRICARVAEIIPSSCVFEYEGAVVAAAPETGRESNIREISVFLKNNKLKAGISEPFFTLSQFPLYYKEARYALDSPRADGAGIKYFRDVAHDFILECCVSRLPAPLLCAREILELRNYDAAHNSLYYKTLAVFLENNKNYTASAKQLHIHRSTLIYRLEQISKISGIDLSDNSKTWYLLLSCKLLENEMNDKEYKDG